MKFVVILVSLFFLSEDPVTIPWNEQQLLSWEDFQGTPDTNSSFAALTHSGIVFNYGVTIENNNILLTTEVEAFFYPEMSWAKPDKINNHILKHEQAHFNITELYARKLRKAFAQYKVTKNYQKDLPAIFTKLNQERRQMQAKFDKETNHSIDVEKEQLWQQYIQEELKKLQNWKQIT
ncbi:DUF922 domain-containing protein [uncultured Planktosalinus sp.]|uniref:DUF922 domain-containing protein n=1 Tax=uncultured Planktosalinus sp. TaxID=1810935 RepID=UPI0030D9BA46